MQHPEEWSAYVPPQSPVGQQRLPALDAPPASNDRRWPDRVLTIDLDTPSPSPPHTIATSPSDSDVVQKPAPALTTNSGLARKSPISALRLEEWKTHMRAALGNDRLEFTLNEEKNRRKPAIGDPHLYMARNPNDKTDWNPNKFEEDHQTPRKPVLWSTHFAKEIDKAVSVPIEELHYRRYPGRLLVYLNSRFNMDYINQQYFDGKMRFFPINEDKLSRRMLDEMLTERKQVLLLPPIEKHGLGLVMAQHDAGSRRTRNIQVLTGELKTTEHIVSLWSPVLVDRSGPTAVLYGIGQLDTDKPKKTVAHLNRVVDRWDKQEVPIPYEAAYYFEKHWPNGFHL